MSIELDELTDEKAKGAPNWMTTFADLMSLLMCFFVLLLSYSVMDVEKFKQIAGSMKMAFGVQSQITLSDIPKGTSVIATEFSPGSPTPTPIETIEQQTSDSPAAHLKVPSTDKAESTKQQEENANTKLKSDFEKLLKPELEQGLIELEMLGQQLIIRLNERGSFSSGSSFLQPRLKPTLIKISEKLDEIPGQIAVSGHTDNLPVNNELHRNNWDLSAKRAAAVLNVLIDKSKLAQRFKLEAYADSKPLLDNLTADNRAKNRRVEISISQGLPTEQTAPSLPQE